MRVYDTPMFVCYRSLPHVREAFVVDFVDTRRYTFSFGVKMKYGLYC